MFKTLIRLAVNSGDPDKALEIMAPLTVGPKLTDVLTELEYLATQLMCWIMKKDLEKSKEFATRLISLPEALIECIGAEGRLVRPHFLEPLVSFTQWIKLAEPTFDTSSFTKFIEAHIALDPVEDKVYCDRNPLEAPSVPSENVSVLDPSKVNVNDLTVPGSENVLVVDSNRVNVGVNQCYVDLCDAVTKRDLVNATKKAALFIQDPLRDDNSLMVIINLIDLLGQTKGYFSAELDPFKNFIKAHAAVDPSAYLVYRINDAMMLSQADFLSENPTFQYTSLLSKCLSDAAGLTGHDDLIKALEDTINYVKQLSLTRSKS